MSYADDEKGFWYPQIIIRPEPNRHVPFTLRKSMPLTLYLRTISATNGLRETAGTRLPYPCVEAALDHGRRTSSKQFEDRILIW